MKNFISFFAISLFCSLSLFGQAQVALVSDNGTNRILGPILKVELISVQAIGRDDCDNNMQFDGTARIDLGGNNGNLTFRFNGVPTDYLQFGPEGLLTNSGYGFGQVDVLFKVQEKDNGGCGSLQDIVDINELPTENALNIRLKDGKVWLLNSQNQEVKILGNFGQIITIKGNGYVNNSVSNTTSNRMEDKRSSLKQNRSGKWNIPPFNNGSSQPDIEVAEFKFRANIVSPHNPNTSNPAQISNLPVLKRW